MIRRWIGRILAFIGLIAILVAGGLYWLSHNYFKGYEVKVPKDAAIVLNIGGHDMPDYASGPFILRQLRREGLSLQDIREVIDDAIIDPRIHSILLNLEGSIGISQAQDLAEVLERFKKAGKTVYAFADTFAEDGNSMGVYYLSTVAKEIWLQPLGSIDLSGYAIESPFAKDLLSKWFVKMQVAKREEYKSYTETYTEDKFSPAARENYTNIITNFVEQAKKEIKKNRKISLETLDEILNTSPHKETKALSYKLVDKIGYFDEIKKAISDHHKKNLTFIKASDYLNHAQLPKDILKKKETDKLKQIAIVFLEGGIMRDSLDYDNSSEDVGGWKAQQSIMKAANDPKVSAIVLRINSGGGSATASETVWRAVELAKAKKPVVVSMGRACASGGYLIAIAANKIVAQPGTLTGSIGVFTGKFVTGDLWKYYGVNWDKIQVGKNANMWSSITEFTPDQWNKIQEMIEETYQAFMGKVAKGRNMTLEQVRAVAKGQVWTGEQAKEKGLVDELGGIDKAAAIAKTLAKIEPSEQVELIPYPKEEPWWKTLFPTSIPEVLKACYAVVKFGINDGLNYFVYKKIQSLSPKVQSMKHDVIVNE